MIILLIVVFASLPARALAESGLSNTISAIAWKEGGNVKLAVANTGNESQLIWAGFGYQLFGAKVVTKVALEVPAQTILLTTHPVVKNNDSHGPSLCDMVYVSDINGNSISQSKIYGIHPSTRYYQVEAYLVPAGKPVIIWLGTPDSDSQPGVQTYLDISQRYSLGEFTGNVVVEKVYTGILNRTKGKDFKCFCDEKDYHHFTFGWRGLLLTMETPEIKGIERLKFKMTKYVKSKEGLLRHDLATPPVMVYGKEITVITSEY